jgi:hypothetical protein
MIPEHNRKRYFQRKVSVMTPIPPPSRTTPIPPVPPPKIPPIDEVAATEEGTEDEAALSVIDAEAVGFAVETVDT